jgi:hypothetical protein
LEILFLVSIAHGLPIGNANIGASSVPSKFSKPIIPVALSRPWDEPYFTASRGQPIGRPQTGLVKEIVDGINGAVDLTWKVMDRQQEDKARKQNEEMAIQAARVIQMMKDHADNEYNPKAQR